MYHFLNLLILILFLPFQVFALTSDREQPLKIEADQAQFDNNLGQAIYEGNVVVTQGSIRLMAHKITIHFSSQQNVTKVVALGKPARFQQQLDRGDDVKAQANEMEYNALENKLHLRQDAELRKEKGGEDTYISNAPCISYDTQKGIIDAEKCNSKKERVITIVIPQKAQK
jgi:lipopolysaccharide export system protein LptA